MSVISDLESKYGGMFLEGKFDSCSLFEGDVVVSIFAEDGATEEDATRCIEHYNGLLENAKVLPVMCIRSGKTR